MLLKTFLFLVAVRSVNAECKCTPADDYWPSQSDWSSLNKTENGKLIANQAITTPCFQGANYDAKTCDSITANWSSSWLLESSPIGYSYPLIQTCTPSNPSLNLMCDLGSAPVFTINATNASDVAAGIKFSKDNNVRLVIKSTGHDVVGRSEGYGSLSILIKHTKDGIHFQAQYNSSTKCKSNWTGSSLTVGGGYVWEDVYANAAEHGTIAVGGSDRSVGVIGGYLQGGGHASGTKPQNALLELCLVGGGKVLDPAPLTSVNPDYKHDWYGDMYEWLSSV
ncbi:FAD-binding domain-containing protein [Aspergillus affinis]|uniref:FAD-binding domain-containing protein n=1 Tax=Aspergillus affinis TaxID=1070780 RepID=UPI0022FEAC33|nr:FAD-binding domain-containing protein [Aspergillus affinis]KAI9038884.1 FAD-binding domain-containing protein [Aspergillus affinis]